MFAVICVNDIKLSKNIESLLKSEPLSSKYNFEAQIFLSTEQLSNIKQEVDLAFLYAGFSNVFELAKGLKAHNPNIVLVFVIKGRRHLNEAMDLGAVRLLFEPVGENALCECMDAACKRLDSISQAFFLKDGKTLVRVLKDDIVFVEIESRKTKVVTKDNVYYSKNSMKFWKEKLKEDNFLSPHNSYIVNLNYMTKYLRNRYVVLRNDQIISVSRTRFSEFNSGVKKYTAVKHLRA